MDKLITLPQAKEVRPQMSANALFHFMKELKFLKTALKKKGLAPRYCKENIVYMNLTINGEEIQYVAYPEKCFCDIHLHQIAHHVDDYGSFGIGLKKTWGLMQGIQPIQYINPNSNLMQDFKNAFCAAVNNKSNEETLDILSNYLISHMVYIKPLMGPNMSRITGEIATKYLSDECEWRYIPNLIDYEMDMVLFNHEIDRTHEEKKSIMDYYNDTLEKLEKTWIRFEYDDIRYLTVVNHCDRDELIAFIKNLDIDENQKWLLVSKIIVLGDAKEDF